MKRDESCGDLASGSCRDLFKDLKIVKVLILGKENVGKTTLLKRILGNWNSKEKRISTDGIDMKQWKPRNKGIANTEVYFWDFAGQELYYATHHFFLTENSINLLMFDCTKSLEENRLLFWLNSIQSRAPGSTVMLVGSFIDQLKDQNQIQTISYQIDILIDQWKMSLKGHTSENAMPRIHRCNIENTNTSFWPVNCREQTQYSWRAPEAIDKVSERYLFEFVEDTDTT